MLHLFEGFVSHSGTKSCNTSSAETCKRLCTDLGNTTTVILPPAMVATTRKLLLMPLLLRCCDFRCSKILFINSDVNSSNTTNCHDGCFSPALPKAFDTSCHTQRPESTLDSHASLRGYRRLQSILCCWRCFTGATVPKP